jgi:hypothetical protein
VEEKKEQLSELDQAIRDAAEKEKRLRAMVASEEEK